MKKTLIFLLAFLAGCAGMSNQYKVTYDSVPQRAALVCNGVNMGYTPVVLYYNIPSIQVKDQGESCYMTWVSGSSTRSTPISMRVVTQYPKGVTVTTHRSKTDPGYETDLQAAYAAEINKPRVVPNNEYQYKPPTNTYCNKVAGQVMCTTY